jgi:hypothetical protein
MSYINKIARLITEDPDLFLESDNLKKELKWLEDDYFGQSHYFQKKDLIKINKLREQLGLPQVDTNLKPTAPEVTPETSTASTPTSIPKPKTMGTNNTEILCDYCEKGIIVEGGEYTGMTAGEAWNASNRKLDYSYISGGVVFLTEENGTFRAYHGYSRRGDCDTKAGSAEALKRKEFNSNKEIPTGISNKLEAFLREEGLPESLVSNIYRANYNYDPGIGINRP